MYSTLPAHISTDKYDFFKEHILPRLRSNTVKAIRSDWRAWLSFISESKSESYWTMSQEQQIATSIDYINWLAAKYKVSTMHRRLAGLSKILTILELPDTTKSWKFQEVKKVVTAEKSAPAKQATAFRYSDYQQAKTRIRSANMTERRAAFIVILAYETLCRADELRHIECSNIERQPDGSGSLLVKRSKNDQTAVGSYRYLTKETMTLVDEWIALNANANRNLYLLPPVSGEHNGNCVRTLKNGKDEQPIDYKTVLHAFKMFGEQFSAHSARVGAVQDLSAMETKTHLIQMAGGWKTPLMVTLYARQAEIQHGAMAKLHRKMSDN